MNVEEIENGIKVTILQKENYTLADLKQELINKLIDNVGNLSLYRAEIELLKIILDYRK